MNQTKVFPKFLLMKSSGNHFIFLPDYVSHEILKEFWKNSRFENMRADFLMRSQDNCRLPGGLPDDCKMTLL